MSPKTKGALVACAAGMIPVDDWLCVTKRCFRRGSKYSSSNRDKDFAKSKDREIGQLLGNCLKSCADLIEFASHAGHGSGVRVPSPP